MTRLVIFCASLLAFGTTLDSHIGRQAPPGGVTQGGAIVQARADEALIIVDIQNFYFEGGLLPLSGPVEAAKQARRVLDRFREKQWPVIHVRHVPANAKETDQYKIHAAVTPLPSETVIVKHYANSFRETELLDYLRQHGIKRLVIAGMQTHMCVEAAARAAADLGFDVTVVADACATRPLEYGGLTVPAAHVHAATLAALKGTYAKIVTADDLLKVR
ncbi:MAG TPA: cysteine hydrolase family protein [Vicinamibacterales bacterium]